MLWLDQSFDSPAHNLACDEALLEWREDAGGADILRFWESPKYFVVLGYTNKTLSEVREEECTRRDIPILRRTSGGGTVLQGRGCFNYSLILSVEAEPRLRNLSTTNDFIMERTCDALQSTLNVPIARQGHTDLTLYNRKFSGNAQRRKRRFLLFHGTILLDFDLSLIAKVLRMPPVRPQYRANRAHEDFVTNLPISRAEVRQALLHAWNTTEVLCDLPHAPIEELAAQKYGSDEWNRKF